jgi:hypothetical protein
MVAGLPLNSCITTGWSPPTRLMKPRGFEPSRSDSARLNAARSSKKRFASPIKNFNTLVDKKERKEEEQRREKNLKQVLKARARQEAAHNNSKKQCAVFFYCAYPCASLKLIERSFDAPSTPIVTP